MSASTSTESGRKAGARGQGQVFNRSSTATRKTSARKGGDSGHKEADTHDARAAVDNSTGDGGGGGQKSDVAQMRVAPSESSPRKRGARGQLEPDTRKLSAARDDMELRQIISGISIQHREHRALEATEGDLTRRIKANQRWAAARRVMASGGVIGNKFPDVLPEDEAVVEQEYPRLLIARKHTSALKADCLAEIELLTKRLPVWPWLESLPAVNFRTLAAMVGEAGDLNRFDGPAKLWKFMGLAVIGDRAQGKVKKGDKKGAAIQKYNPRRRSELFKASIGWVCGNGPYGLLFNERKAYEESKAEASGIRIVLQAEIDPLVRKGADPAKLMSKGHIRKRARRYAEKRFLRDLWREWRKASGFEVDLPLAEAAD